MEMGDDRAREQRVPDAGQPDTTFAPLGGRTLIRPGVACLGQRQVDATRQLQRVADIYKTLGNGTGQPPEDPAHLFLFPHDALTPGVT